jgi:hypothetical protein
VTENNKNTSLLHYGVYYGCKKFFETGPGFVLLSKTFIKIFTLKSLVGALVSYLDGNEPVRLKSFENNQNIEYKSSSASFQDLLSFTLSEHNLSTITVIKNSISNLVLFF